MEGEKVTVLTAGGASSLKKKRNRKRNRKSGNTTAAATATTKKEKELEQHDAVAEAVEVIDFQNAAAPSSAAQFAMEMEEQSAREHDDHDDLLAGGGDPLLKQQQLLDDSMMDQTVEPVKIETLIQNNQSEQPKSTELFWLFLCFIGIMASFVVYGILLEYTTSGGRKLHELSFLFVTSSLYTVTAAAGRYVRAETPTTIPPARFAILGLTSMGSTFCSVRSLRYVA
jgi:hypothetical protein